MLGFEPKDIVFIGDSSGGLLTMVTAMILNDLRKLYPEDSDTIRLPKTIISFYGSFSIEPLLTPSFMTAIVHPFLFPSVFVTMVDSYIPDNIKPGLDDNGNPLLVELVDKESDPMVDKSILNSPLTTPFVILFNYLMIVIRGLYNWLKMVIDLGVYQYQTYKKLFNQSDVWYTKSPESLISHLTEDIRFSSHKYMSPLNYDDFESLSSIRLLMFSMPFEPILDHSVMMARKWKGQVSLDMVDELIHAWLNMYPCLGIYEESYNYSVEKLRDAISNS